MNAFFESGRAVDLILAVMAAEFVLLTIRRGAATLAQRATGLLLAFAPGICLLLALRAALTDAGWIWIAVWLAASFPFHLADLARRRP
jgi:hypothetical protein